MGGSEGMSDKETTHGLACPKCGGMVPVPEGQVIVRCPYCEMRSLVRGERGVQRYQVPPQIERRHIDSILKNFFSESRAIAGDAASQSVLQEAFLVYLPFWNSWARVLGWVFGQKRVGSGDKAHYEPREVQVAQESTWNGAACDVGEFGVTSVPVEGQSMEAFNPESLHQSGMVFEPVGSASEARMAAENDFTSRVQRSAKLDRIAQVFIRLVQARFGLVYYPLWVLRYLYRGRSYQVTIDGYSGQVLYGKAPGNTIYRAAMLVGGMALGAFLAVDASALAFYLGGGGHGDSSSTMFLFGIGLLVVGFGVMGVAYRKFRYGEQYEYHYTGKPALAEVFQAVELLSQVKDLDTWINRLT